MNWAPIRPKRGIFNVAEKGKDYFYLRTGIEILLLLYLLGTMGVIVQHAMGIYPTVVRDYRGQTYVGRPSPYASTPDEMIQFIASTVEVLYLRTDAGTTDALLEPFVAKRIRAAVNGAKPASPGVGFIQTATVTRVIPNRVSPGRFVAYVQVEFELNNFDRVLVDVGYFNARLTQSEPMPGNPGGWVLTDWLEIPKDYFLRERARLQPDADPEPVSTKEQQILSIEY